MISRRAIAFLVSIFTIAFMAFGVLMAFHALLTALGDATAATAVLWIACACLILAILSLIMLVLALGINASQTDEEG